MYSNRFFLIIEKLHNVKQNVKLLRIHEKISIFSEVLNNILLSNDF